MELTLITQMHSTLGDLDGTDIESLYGLAGYLARKECAPGSLGPAQKDTITLHGKTYKRVSADKANWLM